MLRLYLTRHRLYSATLNRFLSSDPLGLDGGLNLYAYGNGNPLTYIDPLGLWSWEGTLTSVGNFFTGAGQYAWEGMSYLGNMAWDGLNYAGNLAWDYGLPAFMSGAFFMADVVEKVWNSPNTALGLLWGGAGWLLGGSRPNFGNNAIEFQNNPLMGTAMTHGNAILYGVKYPPTREINGQTVGNHEWAHTIQGQWLGPVYYPAHIIGGTISLLFTLDWHKANFMEWGPSQNPPRPFF